MEEASSHLSEERLEILRLVENQTVSAEEATRLLEALDRSDSAARTERIPPFPMAPQPMARIEPTPVPVRSRARNVRIRITEGDETQLNLVLPYGLLDSGLKMAKRFAPEHLLDAKEIKESVDDGFVGTILDIQDEDQHVQILIEARE